MEQFTDSACTIRSILRVFERKGCDGGRLLAAIGMSHEALEGPDVRVPLERVEEAWREGYRLTNDPWLALHAAEGLPFGSLGIVDFLCAAAPTACDALRKMCAYFPLINDGLVLATEGGVADHILYLGSAAGRLSPPMIDFVFASILLHTRQSWKRNWSPRRVEFAYPRPKRLEEYARVFRCPLGFDAPISRMVIPRRIWECPLPCSDSALLEVLEQHASSLLALHPPPGDCRARVRSLIGARLREGEASLRVVAKELGLSPRNLQRNLKAVHLSFSQILDDMRAQAARYYLHDPKVPIAEIADWVGFSEASSFTRAFRRWTGTTPTAYRKRVVIR